MTEKKKNLILSSDLPRVIAFTGYQQCGKDTVADYLVEKHGYVHLKFADCLKNMLKAMFLSAGFTEEEALDMIEGEKKEAPFAEFGGKSPRQMMQTLGTEWGRDLVVQNIWANVVRRNINSKPNSRFVISDCRFFNEQEMIKLLKDSAVVRIVRNGKKAKQNHLSEKQIPLLKVDGEMLNEGSVEDFVESAEAFLAKIKNPSFSLSGKALLEKVNKFKIKKESKDKGVEPLEEGKIRRGGIMDEVKKNNKRPVKPSGSKTDKD